MEMGSERGEEGERKGGGEKELACGSERLIRNLIVFALE